MPFHEDDENELLRALTRRIGQSRFLPDFAANLPRRQASPQAAQAGPAVLPQPFQGGATPGQVPFQLQPQGLFGVAPQRQPLGDFSSQFRPLFNPPAPRPIAAPAAINPIAQVLRRVRGAASEAEGGPGSSGGGASGSGPGPGAGPGVR